MKLKELLGYTGEWQTIELIIKKWNITAQAYALECCLNDEALEGTITGINADDDTLVVCASTEKEHDGCAGCRHEDKDFDQEPCKRCRYSGVGKDECDLYEPKEGK